MAALLMDDQVAMFEHIINATKNPRPSHTVKAKGTKAREVIMVLVERNPQTEACEVLFDRVFLSILQYCCLLHFSISA